jgi:uncharacterized protein (DUF952 family)
MSQTILHIISRDAWESARQSAEIRAPSLDSQGFIHFSTAEQVVRVADSIFPGVQDLMLLAVDVDKLTAPLRWEPPDMPGEEAPPTGELFPHLYGPLNADAIRGAVDFPPQPDGTFALPSELETYLKA